MAGCRFAPTAGHPVVGVQGIVWGQRHMAGTQARRLSWMEWVAQPTQRVMANGESPGDITRSPSPNVGIVGLGYVGLPLARAFVRTGIPVLGFDTDPAKVESLRN